MATTVSSILTTFMLIFVSSSLLGFSYGHFNRSEFSAGFLLGAASSAYQYEGAAFEDGRGLSILGTYTHKYAGGCEIDEAFRIECFENVHFLALDITSWKAKSGGINKEGIAFYNNVLANGMTPFVTLFHWDLPQALEDDDDFQDFEELCFEVFGDRIKHWITVNEPFTFANGGYDGGFIGNLAPGRCSSRSVLCPREFSNRALYCRSSSTFCPCSCCQTIQEEPIQKGEIGIALVTHWFIPYSSTEIDGVPMGKLTGVSIFFDYPRGLYSLLVYTKEKYNNPVIYITENGMGDVNNSTIKHAIEDIQRVNFYNGHLRAVHQAIQQGVRVKGFIAWSVLDTFEWGSGYTQRFGICYVDFINKLKRIPKRSTIWFKNFLNAK
ncbi:UNVERIFIED_CONTAM: Beta-glucosidase 24 [Sesamum indicum]